MRRPTTPARRGAARLAAVRGLALALAAPTTALRCLGCFGRRILPAPTAAAATLVAEAARREFFLLALGDLAVLGLASTSGLAAGADALGALAVRRPSTTPRRSPARLARAPALASPAVAPLSRARSLAGCSASRLVLSSTSAGSLASRLLCCRAPLGERVLPGLLPMLSCHGGSFGEGRPTASFQPGLRPAGCAGGKSSRSVPGSQDLPGSFSTFCPTSWRSGTLPALRAGHDIEVVDVLHVSQKYSTSASRSNLSGAPCGTRTRDRPVMRAGCSAD